MTGRIARILVGLLVAGSAMSARAEDGLLVLKGRKAIQTSADGTADAVLGDISKVVPPRATVAFATYDKPRSRLVIASYPRATTSTELVTVVAIPVDLASRTLGKASVLAETRFEIYNASFRLSSEGSRLYDPRTSLFSLDLTSGIYGELVDRPTFSLAIAEPSALSVAADGQYFARLLVDEGAARLDITNLSSPGASAVAVALPPPGDLFVHVATADGANIFTVTYTTERMSPKTLYFAAIDGATGEILASSDLRSLPEVPAAFEGRLVPHYVAPDSTLYLSNINFILVKGPQLNYLGSAALSLVDGSMTPLFQRAFVEIEGPFLRLNGTSVAANDFDPDYRIDQVATFALGAAAGRSIVYLGTLLGTVDDCAGVCSRPTALTLDDRPTAPVIGAQRTIGFFGYPDIVGTDLPRQFRVEVVENGRRRVKILRHNIFRPRDRTAGTVRYRLEETDGDAVSPWSRRVRFNYRTRK